MAYKLSAVFLLGALAAMPSLHAEEFKQVQVTSTERVNFAPGGIVRLNNSYGDLSIEGWDQPVVEITVIKSMPFNYQLKQPEQATQQLERVAIKADRRSDTELAISTKLPSHNRFLSPTLSKTTSGGVGVQYQVHVPRDSRLVIQHGAGVVSVTDVSGDIEATVGRGDILLWLPPGSYSIDAKTRLGVVSSEWEGAKLSQFVIGQRFTGGDPAPSHRLHLRMGFGGITVLRILPESEATH